MSDENPFPETPVDEVKFGDYQTKPSVEEVTQPVFSEKERAQILLPASEAATLVDGFLQLIQTDNGKRLFQKTLNQARVKKIRPANWSKAANAPYYRQQYAEELRPIIDRMIEDGRDKIFLFSHYHTLSPKSLYLKITQAFLFLASEMDTEDLKYFQARERICISREEAGIRLSYTGSSQPISEAVDATSIENRQKWKDDLFLFLESGEKGTKLHLEKLQLSNAEIEEMEHKLSALEGIVYTVSAFEIKVMKL